MGGVSWYIAGFVAGLAGSLHCLGMCGPIFAATSSFYQSPREYLKPLMIHHAGKILSYAGIGLLMGLIGQGVSLLWFQNQVMIVCGILLMIMAFGGMVQWKFAGGLNKRISNLMGKLLGRKGKGSFVLGIVNGLIPCGLVYAAAISAAATQSLTRGALFMVFFGLGTVPALSAVGFSRWLFKMRRIRGLVIWKQIPVLILGVWLFLKGLGLGIPYISPDLSSHEPDKNCCEHHHPRR